MITAKFHKRIPKKIINKCPDIMMDHTSDASRESGDEICWFSFINEAGEDVGCIQLGWDKMEYVNGLPEWTIYVYLFEICKNQRGKGYANEVVKWLENLPQVREIQLSHCDVKSDFGASRDWWLHAGWEYGGKVNLLANFLRKIIK